MSQNQRNSPYSNIHSVPLIAALSAVAVSHRKPAFAATSRDTSGAQDGDKRNVLWCGVCVRAMQTHRRLELLLHPFLSSALDGGE